MSCCTQATSSISSCSSMNSSRPWHAATARKASRFRIRRARSCNRRNPPQDKGAVDKSAPTYCSRLSTESLGFIHRFLWISLLWRIFIHSLFLSSRYPPWIRRLHAFPGFCQDEYIFTRSMKNHFLLWISRTVRKLYVVGVLTRQQYILYNWRKSSRRSTILGMVKHTDCKMDSIQRRIGDPRW